MRRIPLLILLATAAAVLSCFSLRGGAQDFSP